MVTTKLATTAVCFVAVVVGLLVLDRAASLFAPVVLALVIGVVLSPLSRRIDRLGAPHGVSAFLTLAMILALIVGLVILLGPIVEEIFDRAPVIWVEIREVLSSLQSTAQGIDQVSEQVADALNESGPGTEDAPKDRVEVPTLADALMLAPSLAAWLLIFAGTLYFFLLSRREVYDWISRTGLVDSAAVMVEAEREVSRYFLTITLINAGFGTLIALALIALGMPYAILWGFILFVANFILYLGPAIYAVALLVAGIVSFDGLASFLPAIVFVGMNLIEAQFVTPSLIGRQMKVNPLLVFLSLVFWLWLWGPIGGIVAIPLLVWGISLNGRRRRPNRDVAVEPAVAAQ
ncbi:MAG: AI-2E family transporter [Jannaschia sp.]